MKIISNKRVQVFTSDELKEILEGDNDYKFIYFGNDITLDSGICINGNKNDIVINGTYDGVRYKLTGMNSNERLDTIYVNSNNMQVQVKNVDIEYTNTYGVIYVPLENIGCVTIYNNIKFNGTQLSFNPYGSTKIVDSIILLDETNNVPSQEVCESNQVIIGGKTNISSNSLNSPMFTFRNDTASCSFVFLCKSEVTISCSDRSFMNGTGKLNFTILHDTTVNLTTGNGFSELPGYGANNVLIDERATFKFIENNHQRIPMWTILGSFTMKKDSTLHVINSYDNTPSDNYNLHFKGNNQVLTLEEPREVVIYTKNANVIYANNSLTFKITCSRINMWNNSTALVNAGGIDNLPDYFWYKNNVPARFEGVLTSGMTAITSHNLAKDELSYLSDIGNFSFQSRKQFSIGSIPMNIHEISSTRLKISGHSRSFADILIKYNNVSEVVSCDYDGLFEYSLTTPIDDNTNVEITSNVPSSFIYETRRITSPHNGELSLLTPNNAISFVLSPFSTSPLLLPRNKALEILVVDSRVTRSNFRILAYINSPLKSSSGFIMENALVYKNFDDEIVVLDNTPRVVFTSVNDDESVFLTRITCSKEKGPLIDLSNNALEINEEYFAVIYFVLE